MRVRNMGSVTIQPWAAMETLDRSGTDLCVRVRRPTTDGIGNVLINGPIAIGQNSTSDVLAEYPRWVIVSGTSQPDPNDELGVAAGTQGMIDGNMGFKCLSFDEEGTRALVIPFSQASGSAYIFSGASSGAPTSFQTWTGATSPDFTLTPYAGYTATVPLHAVQTVPIVLMQWSTAANYLSLGFAGTGLAEATTVFFNGSNETVIQSTIIPKLGEGVMMSDGIDSAYDYQTIFLGLGSRTIPPSGNRTITGFRFSVPSASGESSIRWTGRIVIVMVNGYKF